VIKASELSEEQQREFIIKDNVGFGEWDWEMLGNEWPEDKLEEWGLDLPDMSVTNLEAEEDDFDVPDGGIETDIVQGDLFEIGDHRLLCGDSTDSDAVARLMNGMKAELCFTSPPYWVGKDYEYQNSEKEIDEFIMAIGNVICLSVKVDFGRIVINTGTASINRIDKKRKVEILPLIDKWQKALKQHGWLMRHLRIWAKRGQLPASISPKTDVIDQHNEYIAEFENLDFSEEYRQIPTFWNQAGQQRGQERINTKWAQQGLWDDIHGEKSAGGKHNAAFPVEIPARNILLYTKENELLYEPFTGSGTTIVAAHQLNRKCYGMELDPKYCQVVVDRMRKLDSGLIIKRNGEVI
jgi:DNA modification methylase